MARYYGYGYGYDYSSYLDYLLNFPVHLFFFMAVLFLVLGFSWYINYESMLEDMMSQLRLFLIICPVLLLLLVHLLSSDERRKVPFFITLPERDSLHRAGGSPWGVAAVLVLLLFMVSHRSALQERWFPLLAR